MNVALVIVTAVALVLAIHLASKAIPQAAFDAIQLEIRQ